MGAEVSARSDLCSLGALLNEMVCGGPPFLGDDDVAVIGRHINTPPVAPGWHRGYCPRSLDSLTRRLLAKAPENRPSSAEEVLSILESIDPEATGETGTERGGAALDSVAGGVFVSRQKETSRLRAGC